MKVAASSIARALLVGVALSQIPVAGVSAQGACSPGMPAGVFCGERNIVHATAGTYAIDGDHSAVLARVSHIGYSWSVFRFDRVSGTLHWDSAAIAKSTLSVKVETGSITSNVKGFAEQLVGDQFLKSGAFPEATFVSTAFRPSDAARGKVDGLLTLMGKTNPVTFDVELVGAGKGFGDQPRVGILARATIKPQDYGMMPMFVDPIEIVVDTEFARNP